MKNLGQGKIVPALCGSHFDILWKFEEVKNGVYTIKSMKDNYLLSYSNYSNFNFYGIIAKEKNLNEIEKFNLWNIDIFIDKEYKMLYNIEYNKCLSLNKIEEKLHYNLEKCDETNSKFAFDFSIPNIEKFVGKFVVIKSLFTDLCVKYFEENKEIKQAICNKENEFLWKIEKIKDEDYFIITNKNGNYLNMNVPLNMEINYWKIFDSTEKNSFIFDSNINKGKCIENKGLSISNSGYLLNPCSNNNINQSFVLEEI